MAVREVLDFLVWLMSWLIVGSVAALACAFLIYIFGRCFGLGFYRSKYEHLKRTWRMVSRGEEDDG